MIVGEVTMDDLLEALPIAEQKLSRPINPTVYARQELRRKIHSGNHFLKATQAAPLEAVNAFMS